MPGRSIHAARHFGDDDRVIDNALTSTVLQSSTIVAAVIIAVTLAALLFMDLPDVPSTIEQTQDGRVR